MGGDVWTKTNHLKFYSSLFSCRVDSNRTVPCIYIQAVVTVKCGCLLLFLRQHTYLFKEQPYFMKSFLRV
jgi:hypothetical protein